VIRTGALACGHARIRAWKSRLLTRSEAAPLFTAADEHEMERAVAALERRDPMARLLRIYDVAIRGYPHGAALFRALRDLHEIENVKLRWHRGERAAEAPFQEIAETVTRAHSGDPAAASLAFDRWASQRVLDEAMRLPPCEALARKLAGLVVRERDAQLTNRAAKWYGLTSVSAAVIDVAALRRERLRQCRRAFTGDPFLLAPALAVVLLAEEEVRAVRALVERRGDASLDEALQRTLAASQIGAS
jgi:hypothetical protein